MGSGISAMSLSRQNSMENAPVLSICHPKPKARGPVAGWNRKILHFTICFDQDDTAPFREDLSTASEKRARLDRH